MGHGYKNQPLNHSRGSIFLPMLCSKPSVAKDVVRLPRLKHKKSSDDDPLSPKISCMGQVKRNNRIIGFPALDLTTKINSFNTKSSSSNNNSNIKYLKLKKLFSSNSFRRKEALVNGGKADSGSSSIKIENMDPPLPVIKRVPKQGDKGDGNTLWQRRSRGVSLENLQLQQLQLNRRQEPNTV